MFKMGFIAAIFFGVLVFWGCASDDSGASGALDISVSGGAALREGFPHKEGGTEHAFADGWRLQFTKYVVSITGITLYQPEEGEVVGYFNDYLIVDLKGEAAKEAIARIEEVPARRLEIEFKSVTPKASSNRQFASEEDIEEMIKKGCSALVEGEAVKGEKAVLFKFCLKSQTHYFDCINGKDGTKGIAIEADKTTGAFIYAHGIHLFWNTLASGDERLRFEAFAAVAGEDGLVTEEELSKQDLTDLRDAEGDPLTDENGKRVYYNDGGMLPPNKLNLLEFVEYAHRASMHFNGVGLCNMKTALP